MTQEILPKEPELALKRLLKFAQDLIVATQDEAQALDTKDPVDLKLALARKEDLSVTYEKAAAEFRARLEDFQGIDKALVHELQEAQAELKKLIEENNQVYKRTTP